MAWKNPETWTPDKPVTDVDFNRIEENLRVLEASSRELPVTAGSANAYTATIQDLIGLVAGRKITVKFHTAGTGASTLNVNSLGAKSITKPGGGNPNLKAGGIYNLVYDGTSFQLLGEGGDLGTATPDKVLKPYTVPTENGLEEGTIEDRRSYEGVEQSSPNLVDIVQHPTYPASAIIKIKPTFSGYMDGTTTIQQNIVDLNPDTIKDGVKVGNSTKFIAGRFTSDANAVAAYMLTGNSAYVKGLKVNGSMANRGSPQITLTNQGDQYNLSSGYYSGGFVKILLTNLTASVIKDGIKVGNITGTYIPHTPIDDWIKRTSNFPTNNTIYDICHGNGLYVVVGNEGRIATSPTGVTWTLRTSGVTVALFGVRFLNGLFIAVGGQGTILTSTDGITWTKRAISGVTSSFMDVAYGNGIYMAVGQGNAGIWTSTDGTTWNKVGTTENNRVVFGNGKFATLPHDSPGWIRYTTNGTTWNSTNIVDTHILNDIIFDGSRFIAVGYYGAVRVSTDAITWSAKNFASASETIESICYGNGVYVIGANQYLYFSSTTNRWVGSTRGFDNGYPIKRVFFGNDLFIAAGGAGGLATSK